MKPLKHILLVEDDPKSRYALQTVLEQKGYKVTAFGSAEEARMMDSDHMEVAIIDVRLPLEQGSAFAHNLMKTHGHIKVIFVTAYDDLEDLGTRIKGASVLMKPIDINALLKLL